MSKGYIPVFRHRKQQRWRQWPWRRRAGDIRNRPRPREVPVRKGWRWIESRWAGQRQSCFLCRVRWLFPLRHFPESPLLPLQSLISHPLYSCGGPGSAITSGREPRSCLGRVFNLKLGCFVSEKCNCRACTRPLLELKTRPRFHPVS
jgi:hypothetical protein